MTDIEIVTACAKAMGIQHYVDGIYVECRPEPPALPEWWIEYMPLRSDAQNAALDDVLLKHGKYEMKPWAFLFYVGDHSDGEDMYFTADMTIAANRRRARCECVAKLEGV